MANAGISGEMVRDLMIAAVERRFGTAKTPHKVEGLSDNGAYIAKPPAEAAAALGLTLLFTPVRSPFARKQWRSSQRFRRRAASLEWLRRYVRELREDPETRLPG